MKILASSSTGQITDFSTVHIQNGISRESFTQEKSVKKTKLFLVHFPDLPERCLDDRVKVEMEKHNVKRTSPNLFLSYIENNRSLITDGLIVNSLIPFNEPGESDMYNYLYVKKGDILEVYLELDSLDTSFGPTDLFVVEKA
jgi:hypothetical protein